MKPYLNKNLFWDTNFDNIDFDKHSRWVIGRVLTRGNLDDYSELKKYYGIDKIKEEVVKIRQLDKKTLNFCSKIFEIDKKEFKCFNTEQSIRKLWNY